MRTPRFLKKDGILYVIFGILALLGTITPFILFALLLRTVKFHAEDRQPILSFTDFLATASWAQAFIAAITFLVVTLAAVQIIYLKQQTEMEQERSAREFYRPLISAEVQSTKRMLYSKDIQLLLSQAAANVKNIEGAYVEEMQEKERKLRDDIQIILDDTRLKFDQVAATIPLPLMPGNRGTFDHVEAMLNEYNYLAKLILDGKLKSEYHTDLGRENFKKVHNLVLPLLLLRRKLSPKYASHFSEYCATVGGT